jgi:hypothetical protein
MGTEADPASWMRGPLPPGAAAGWVAWRAIEHGLFCPCELVQVTWCHGRGVSGSLGTLQRVDLTV